MQKHYGNINWYNLPGKEFNYFKRFKVSISFDPEIPLQETTPGNTICVKSEFLQTMTLNEG